MSNDDFDGPGSTISLPYEEVKGALLMITPHVQEKAIPTEFGENDAIRADIVVLDGPSAGEEYPDTLIFPRVLQSQIRRNVGTGRRNLGRLGQGVKKPGKSAPWELGEPSEADKAIARAYLAKNTESPF